MEFGIRYYRRFINQQYVSKWFVLRFLISGTINVDVFATGGDIYLRLR